MSEVVTKTFTLSIMNESLDTKIKKIKMDTQCKIILQLKAYLDLITFFFVWYTARKREEGFEPHT